MINLTLRLRNGETREVQAYDYGVLAIHKSISPFEKALWQLTHKPTGVALTAAKTKKELIEIAVSLNAYAHEHLDLLKWTGSDLLEIFSGKNGEPHRKEIRKICKRA